MFELLKTPEESYRYKLGAALKMEQTVLEILEAGIEQAHSEQVRATFARHHSESEEHVHTLKAVFGEMDWEVGTSPGPAVDGLQAEGEANAKKVDGTILDAMLLQNAIEVEHHEIAVYESLIDGARAMGRRDVVELLTRNLQNEQQTLSLARGAHQKLMAVSFADRAHGGIMGRLKSAIGM